MVAVFKFTVVTVPPRFFLCKILERHEERDRRRGQEGRDFAGATDAHRTRSSGSVHVDRQVRGGCVLKQTLNSGRGGVVVARARDSRGIFEKIMFVTIMVSVFVLALYYQYRNTTSTLTDKNRGEMSLITEGDSRVPGGPLRAPP